MKAGQKPGLKPGMISVDDALAALTAVAPLGGNETAPVGDAAGRVLAKDVTALRTQPPRDNSAMDGYAVRFRDVEAGCRQFTVIGEAPAGGLFGGMVGEAQAVRIFTGGSVPDGADTVIIQENAKRDGDTLQLLEADDTPRHIRKAGQDFAVGDILLSAGSRLGAADLTVAATGNHAALTVTRRPRVAFIASGDELVPPGQADKDTLIPDSNSVALAAMVAAWGGDPVAHVLTPDDKDRFTHAVKGLPEADIIVPVGGASVGDYDYAKSVFYDLGYAPVFEKIAVKPGKPCWFAEMPERLVLGLPGNPSSALVTATLFLRPLIERLAGQSPTLSLQDRMLTGKLLHDLPANGPRETWLRGSWASDAGGALTVTTANRQDSALTTVFAAAGCLLRRETDAPALKAGAPVSILPL